MFAKHTKGGNQMVKLEERAFRHHSNQMVRQGRDDIAPAGTRQRIG